MTHDEMIEVIKAHNEGKRLEYRLSWDNGNGQWLQLDNFNEHFDFSIYEYRIKPKKKANHSFKVGDKIVFKDDEGLREFSIFTIESTEVDRVRLTT